MEDVSKVCQDFGPFDIIVDDGGHTTPMMVISFKILFTMKCIKDYGVYVIEDTHTMSMYPTPENKYEGKDIYGHLADYQRQIISHRPLENNQKNDQVIEPFISHLSAIHVYDSLISQLLNYYNHHFRNFIKSPKPIETFSCKNKQEATLRERYWYEILNGNLNSQCPARTLQEHQDYQKNIDKLILKNKETINLNTIGK